MTRDELDRIPDHLLKRSGRVGLLLWLKLSGLTMTLAELDDERRRRGIMRERG